MYDSVDIKSTLLNIFGEKNIWRSFIRTMLIKKNGLLLFLNLMNGKWKNMFYFMNSKFILLIFHFLLLMILFSHFIFLKSNHIMFAMREEIYIYTLYLNALFMFRSTTKTTVTFISTCLYFILLLLYLYLFIHLSK